MSQDTQITERLPPGPEEYAAFQKQAQLLAAFLQQRKLLAEGDFDPSAFAVLGLTAGPAPPAEVDAAYDAVITRLRGFQKIHPRESSSARTLAAEAKRLLSDPEVAAAYARWYEARHAPAPAPLTPNTQHATPPQPVHGPTVPVWAAAVAAFGALGLFGVFVLRPLLWKTPQQAAVTPGPVVPSSTGERTPAASPTPPPGVAEARENAEKAKRILNDVGAEVSVATAKQARGEVTAAEAAALQARLAPKLREAVRLAAAAEELDPTNPAAPYQRAVALYYLGEFRASREAAEDGLGRFPGDSDLQAIARMAKAR